MYVAVPEATPQIDYAVTVSARLADGTVSSSATVDVKVVAAEEARAAKTPTESMDLKLPDVDLNREDIKANIAEKITGLTGGISEDVSEDAGKAGDKLAGLKDNLATFKSMTMDFLFTKTYWFFNWLWIVIIVIVFAIIGVAVKALPDEDEEPKKNNKKGKNDKGGFWKKIEDFLDED